MTSENPSTPTVLSARNITKGVAAWASLTSATGAHQKQHWVAEASSPSLPRAAMKADFVYGVEVTIAPLADTWRTRYMMSVR